MVQQCVSDGGGYFHLIIAKPVQGCFGFHGKIHIERVNFKADSDNCIFLEFSSQRGEQSILNSRWGWAPHYVELDNISRKLLYYFENGVSTTKWRGGCTCDVESASAPGSGSGFSGTSPVRFCLTVVCIT